MRPLRMLLLVALAISGCVIVGSAVAGMSFAKNDECSQARGAYVPQEGRELPAASLQAWPFGTRCEYDFGGGETRSLFFGPSVGESAAWVVAVVLLFVAALLRRRCAPLRGAAVAACHVALVSAALQYSDFVLAAWVAVLPGAMLVGLLDFTLVQRGERSCPRSLLVAVTLSPLVFLMAMLVYIAGFGRLSVVAGVLVGALVSAFLPHVRAAATSPRARSARV